MEFMLVVAIFMLIACVIELMRQNEDLERENEFLKEQWINDIQRDIERTKKEMARLDRL